MAQRNVESFRRGLDAFNRRDIDAFLEESHPDSVVYASMAAMLSGEETEIHGHDEYRKFFKGLEEAFSEFRIEIGTRGSCGR